MARINQVLAFTQTATSLTWQCGSRTTTLELANLSQEVKDRAVLHGLKQRCGDKAALGMGASPEAKFDAVKAMVDHYNSGSSEWNITRTGGGRKSEADWVVQAIAALYDEELSDAEARIAMLAADKDMTPEAMCKVLATAAKVATKIAELKHGSSDIDADDLLSDI